MRDNFIVKKDFTGLPCGFQGVKFLTVQDSALSWSPASPGLLLSSTMSSKSEGHSVLCNSLPPMDYTVHGILQARILLPFPSPGPEPQAKLASGQAGSGVTPHAAFGRNTMGRP